MKSKICRESAKKKGGKIPALILRLFSSQLENYVIAGDSQCAGFKDLPGIDCNVIIQNTAGGRGRKIGSIGHSNGLGIKGCRHNLDAYSGKAIGSGG